MAHVLVTRRYHLLDNSPARTGRVERHPAKHLPHSESTWVQTARPNICTYLSFFAVPPLRLKGTIQKGKQQ